MRRSRWRTWVIANVLRGTGGLLVGIRAAVVSAGLGFGLLIGLGLGLAQRHVLAQAEHPHSAAQPMPSRRWWIVVSALGGIVPGWLILVAVVRGASNGGQPVTDRATSVGGLLGAATLFGAIAGALAGGAAGAVQGWSLYRGRSGRRELRSAGASRGAWAGLEGGRSRGLGQARC